MRPTIASLLILSACQAAGTAIAAPLWCAVSNEGASNCTFASMDQCRAATSGTGGFCMPEAPIGHRQPRPSANANSVRRDELDKKIEQINRKLDHTLEICRGCQ
jgi:hypothetical protein